MKSLKIASLFIVLAAIATLFTTQSFKTQPQDVYMGPPVFLFKHDAPKLMDDATLQRNAQNWAGIKAGKLTKSEGRSAVAASTGDATESFEQDAQGSIRFNRNLQKYGGDFVPKLPAADQVEGIARNFLTQNNLLPQNAGELKVAHIGGVNSTEAVTNKRIEKLRTVHFSREIDGIPVIGPGSKIVVKIGDRNEIQSVLHRWKEVASSSPQNKTALKTNELKGEMEAKEEVTTRIKKDWGAKANFKMNEPKMAYFDSNDGYIQPVYIFEATITPDGFRDKEPQKYLGMVSAMKNAPENIISEVAVPRDVKVGTAQQDAAPTTQPDKD